jgi:hypothetical protein
MRFRAAGEVEREHHADQREQQRQHDRERRGERAELHHEHEVHHEDAHEQRDSHFREQLVLIARRTAEIDTEARRVLHGIRNLLRLRTHRARVDTLHVAGNRHGALAVVVLDARRTLVDGDGRDLLERHHHVRAGHGDRQVFDVGRVEAVFG